MAADPRAKSPSQRQQRAGAVLQRALCELLREPSRFHPHLGELMLSITNVHMTADLKLAKVYVMPLGGEEHAPPKTVLEVLKEAKVRLRQSLAGMVGMRYMPDLKFYWDDRLEQELKIEQLFHNPKVRQDLQSEEREE